MSGQNIKDLKEELKHIENKIGADIEESESDKSTKKELAKKLFSKKGLNSIQGVEGGRADADEPVKGKGLEKMEGVLDQDSEDTFDSTIGLESLIEKDKR